MTLTLAEYANMLRQSGEWARWPRANVSEFYRRVLCNQITNRPDLAPAPFRDGFEARVDAGELWVRWTGEMP